MLINEDVFILHGLPRARVACDTAIGVVAAFCGLWSRTKSDWMIVLTTGFYTAGCL